MEDLTLTYLFSTQHAWELGQIGKELFGFNTAFKNRQRLNFIAIYKQ